MILCYKDIFLFLNICYVFKFLVNFLGGGGGIKVFNVVDMYNINY